MPRQVPQNGPPLGGLFGHQSVAMLGPGLGIRSWSKTGGDGKRLFHTTKPAWLHTTSSRQRLCTLSLRWTSQPALRNVGSNRRPACRTFASGSRSSYTPATSRSPSSTGFPLTILEINLGLTFVGTGIAGARRGRGGMVIIIIIIIPRIIAMQQIKGP